MHMYFLKHSGGTQHINTYQTSSLSPQPVPTLSCVVHLYCVHAGQKTNVFFTYTQWLMRGEHKFSQEIIIPMKLLV